MQRRSAAAVGAVILTFCLSSCASPADAGGEPVGGDASEISTPSQPTESAARNQAQAWLDSATLPPGAVRSDVSVGSYLSYTGWPCGPIEELEAFWTIPDMSVSDAANWLIENPTADLVTTAPGPVPEGSNSAIVGYIPERDAQEGIVYTLAKTADGVAVRAEIAALTASATCPELPDGGVWGPPGQG